MKAETSLSAVELSGAVVKRGYLLKQVNTLQLDQNLCINNSYLLQSGTKFFYLLTEFLSEIVKLPLDNL